MIPKLETPTSGDVNKSDAYPSLLRPPHMTGEPFSVAPFTSRAPYGISAMFMQGGLDLEKPTDSTLAVGLWSARLPP